MHQFHVSECVLTLQQVECMELLRCLPPHQQLTCVKRLVIGTRLLLRNDNIVFDQQVGCLLVQTFDDEVW